MTTSEVSSLIAAVSVVIALVFNLIGNRRVAKRETQKESADMTTVVVKLENIATGVTEIKTDMRNIRADVTENRERIVAVEASAKQAHKRMDTFENRKDRA